MGGGGGSGSRGGGWGEWRSVSIRKQHTVNKGKKGIGDLQKNGKLLKQSTLYDTVF